MSGVEAYKKRLEEKHGKKEEPVQPRLEQQAEVPIPFSEPSASVLFTSYRTLEGHTAPVTSVVFSADGKYVVSGSEDGTVRSWNPLTGAPFLTFPGKRGREFLPHTGAVNCVRVFPDSRYVASASDDTFVKLWDIRTGDCVRDLGHDSGLKGFSPCAFTSVTISPDKGLLAAGTSRGYVHLLGTGPSRTKPVYHQTLELGSHINSMCFSLDSAYLAVGRSDSPVAVFELDARKEYYQDRHDLSDLSGQSNLDSFLFSRKGDALVQTYAKLSLSGSSVQALSFWDISDRPLPSAPYMRVERASISKIRAIGFYGKDTLLLSGSDDGCLRAWDLQRYTPVGEIVGHDKGITCLAVSSNEQMFATGSFDKTLKLWKVKRA